MTVLASDGCITKNWNFEVRAFSFFVFLSIYCHKTDLKKSKTSNNFEHINFAPDCIFLAFFEPER